jgi:hypothetical protein
VWELEIEWWLQWLEWESLWAKRDFPSDVITWNIGPQSVDLSIPQIASPNTLKRVGNRHVTRGVFSSRGEKKDQKRIEKDRARILVLHGS